MNELYYFLSTLDPLWIYVTVLLVTYIENIFPPSPSDIIVVFGGTLAALDKGNFIIVLLAGGIGSTLGFLTMYMIGRWFGHKILETGKIKFIPPATVQKIESWFQRYGYWVIVANRFLAGTRAVISFFAGLSELDLYRTTILSGISSFIWYGILIYVGYSVGQNWQEIGIYLSTYSRIVTGIFIILILILLVRYLVKKYSGHASNG